VAFFGLRIRIAHNSAVMKKSKLFSTLLILSLSLGSLAPVRADVANSVTESMVAHTSTVAIPEIEVQGPKSFVITTQKGNTYTFPILSENAEWLQQFYNLSAESQGKFQEQRGFLLTRAAAILDHSQLTLGLGSLVKNKITQIFKRGQKPKQPMDQLAEQSLKIEGSHSRSAQTVRERGQAIASRILTALDARLWQQSPIVARQNEVSFSMTVNLVGMAGVGNKVGGGSAGLGVSIGYNRDSKAVVFEVFTELERMEKSFTPTFLAGITPKFGLRISDKHDGAVSTGQSGHSVYPPGAPGYMLNHSDQVEMGMNTSFMAFPPMVGDLFSYINKNTRQLLVRVSISPALSKFVQFQTGIVGLPRAVWNSITAVANSVQQRSTQLCRRFLDKEDAA
jgi:hypothetical protein